MNIHFKLLQAINKLNIKNDESLKEIKLIKEDINTKGKSINNIENEIKKNKEQYLELNKKNEDIIDKIENIKLNKPKDGINGRDGKDGINGTDGKDGVDGRDGYTPIKGKDYFDGKDGVDGKDGKDGIDGRDGISVIDAKIDNRGHLIIYFSDKTKKDVGLVKGKDGIGFRGISVENIYIENNHLICVLSNKTKIDAGVISGGGGDTGEETDPIFTNSPAYTITTEDITNWNNKSNFSGSYDDLTDKPTLFSGNYNDLTNKPDLFSGSYNDLTDKPVLFSGDYDDLTNKPSLFSGDYNDLTNKPTIPTKTSELDNNSGYITDSYHDSTKQNVINDLETIRSGASLGATALQPNDNVSSLVNDANYITNFYIPITTSNTTTIKWSELYGAYVDNKNVIAKIEYLQSGATIPVIVPLYSVIGGQSGGSFMFTFVMGTSTITYIVTGTGDNTCTITKQERNFELIENKTNDIITNSTSTILYPSAKAVYDGFQRRPVVIWESSTPSEYLKAVQSNISASPAWQLTNLDMTPYKRIKIYTCAGQGTGTTASASTTPAIVLEMSLDERARIGAYGDNYVASIVVQKPNDANRLATLTCAVSSDKTSFVVLRQTNLYGTAATSNNDVNANVFMIEGYYD